ncbi:RecQ family ATP-dependent DNA helicase [Candidatus Gracilibacteria bacterium]|nr:RecQ family ATP-dependent DNA helicase [Candidatus Gracilibacteria bacterium]
MQNLNKILKESFGLESFLEGQEEIIQSVIDSKDTLVFIPTGGGKSLTYQLPGVVLPGLTIVISPLISLMKDQLDKLNELKIRTEIINSTISGSEQKQILDELNFTDYSEQNPIKFLYIAPERLNSREFLEAISNIKISLVAIDEAHCISQWGHDFRPSYMKIKNFLTDLKKRQNFPVMALTATATKKVRADIVDRLGLVDYNVFTKGFDRKNIILLVKEISKKEEKLAKTLEIIEKTPGSGIIYCSSIKMVEEVHEFLKSNGVDVGIYNGSLGATLRENEQNKFMNSTYKVIVATNAFGMGIDKSDIRFVIHYNLPGSIENYYQEVGRAGRDGLRSYGVVLASFGDTKIQEFFIENTYPAKSEILDFYDYLFKEFKLGEGKGTQILKTYYQMSKESGIGSDMRVGSILKILEKYGIVSRGVDEKTDEGFRGKGITLVQEKRKHSGILVDWQRQDLLKKEAYFKLEQIKKLLFYPSCRRRFILEYFQDEEDLATLGESCRTCDYCIDKLKLESRDVESIVNLSVFGLVLEVIKKLDNKFGIMIFIQFLSGAEDKKITNWRLDEDENFGILKEYSPQFIQALIEGLLTQGYLAKASGLYPVIGLTDKGNIALRREIILKNEEKELQSFITLRSGSNIFKKSKPAKATKSKKTTSSKTKKTSGKISDTYLETLELFDKGNKISEIANLREMTTNTIESHLIKLFETGKLTTVDLLKIANTSNVTKVQEIIKSDFADNTDKLRPIKDKIVELGFGEITYFEIKVAISLQTK